MPPARAPSRDGIQLATMGNDVDRAVRQNIDRLASGLDNLQALGTAGGRDVAQGQLREIGRLRQDLVQLRTLVNALNQRLTAAGF